MEEIKQQRNAIEKVCRVERDRSYHRRVDARKSGQTRIKRPSSMQGQWRLYKSIRSRSVARSIFLPCLVGDADYRTSVA